jgi:hypothetical protein
MKSSDHGLACNQALARIIGKTVRSSGSRMLIAEVAKEFITGWAGDSKIRKKIAEPALWAAGRLGRPGKEKPDGSTAADAGILLTELARKVNAGRAAEKPVTGDGGASLDAFLSNTDFGEILEMVEGSDPKVIEAIRTFNGQLWKYPAKVGALVASLNALANTSLKSANEILKPIDEQFSPDLLADLLLSTVRDIKGTSAAMLVNTVCELIRRIHTGSLRLGKGGRPLFQTYLTGLLNDLLPVLKPELLKKARIALAEDGEAWANSLADALRSSPAVLLAFLSSLGAVQSSRARAMSRKLKSLKETDQAGLDAAVSESVSDLDTYEIAGLVNAALGVLERIHQARPDIVAGIAGGIVDSLDADQLKRICGWLIPDLAAAFRPVLQALAPEIGRSTPAAAGGEQ